MIKSGHIRFIDGKVKFEYYELLKPDQNNVGKYIKNSNKYFDDLKEYEASKRTIEVSNEQWDENNKTNGKIRTAIFIQNEAEWIKNNSPCKAEVNGTATIVELN